MQDHKANADILKKAAKEIRKMAAEELHYDTRQGIQRAADHLHKLAERSHNMHKKQIKIERENARASDAKARAFGMGR